MRIKRLDLGPLYREMLSPKILIPSPGRYVYYSVLSREKAAEAQSSEGASPRPHSHGLKARPSPLRLSLLVLRAPCFQRREMGWGRWREVRVKVLKGGLQEQDAGVPRGWGVMCPEKIGRGAQGSPGTRCEAVAAAAKSLQSCPTLCDPIDGSPPGSSVPGILQARTQWTQGQRAENQASSGEEEAGGWRPG